VPALAACLCVGVVGVIGLTALRFQPKQWNASTFTDTLTGRIVRDSGVTRGIVSLAGNGEGSQRVLVRADLLIAPQRLLSTSFQMEYLPSGALCSGRVTKVHDYGFEAACRTSGGPQRFISASWQPSNGVQLVGGLLKVHA